MQLLAPDGISKIPWSRHCYKIRWLHKTAFSDISASLGANYSEFITRLLWLWLSYVPISSAQIAGVPVPGNPHFSIWSPTSSYMTLIWTLHFHPPLFTFIYCSHEKFKKIKKSFIWKKLLETLLISSVAACSSVVTTHSIPSSFVVSIQRVDGELMRFYQWIWKFDIW